MTTERYRPRKLEDALARLGEEANEIAVECNKLAKAVCKAQRFGLNDTNPNTGKRNIQEIRERITFLKREIADLWEAQDDFNEILAEIVEGATCDLG